MKLQKSPPSTGPSKACGHSRALLRGAALAAGHEIDSIGVLRDQQRARAVGVRPCCSNFPPAPVRRIVGTLSRREAVLDPWACPPEP